MIVWAPMRGPKKTTVWELGGGVWKARIILSAPSRGHTKNCWVVVGGEVWKTRMIVWAPMRGPNNNCFGTEWWGLDGLNYLLRPVASPWEACGGAKTCWGGGLRGLEDPNDCLGPDGRDKKTSVWEGGWWGLEGPNLLSDPLRGPKETCRGGEVWKTRVIACAPMRARTKTPVWEGGGAGSGRPELSSPPRCERTPKNCWGRGGVVGNISRT